MMLRPVFSLEEAQSAARGEDVAESRITCLSSPVGELGAEASSWTMGIRMDRI